MSVVAFNPCITCGACCAFYRASFYWSEAAPELGGTVPRELTEKLNGHLVYMKGSWSDKPRCIALHGTIGEQVTCAIYPRRASICRDFRFAWDGGLPNERCDKARAAWGLSPLENPIPDHHPASAELNAVWLKVERSPFGQKTERCVQAESWETDCSSRSPGGGFDGVEVSA